MSIFESKKYEIIPTETYKMMRNCSGCGNKSVYHNTNKVRVNANGKLLDIWLIYQCSQCKHTYNLPIYSRINKDTLDKSEYEALLKSSPEIVTRHGLDRKLFQKNDAMIFKEPAYVLKDTCKKGEGNTIEFSNPHQIRVRYDKLIAECCKISRSQAKKLLETGLLKVNKPSADEVVFAVV